MKCSPLASSRSISGQRLSSQSRRPALLMLPHRSHSNAKQSQGSEVLIFGDEHLVTGFDEIRDVGVHSIRGRRIDNMYSLMPLINEPTAHCRG